MRRLSQLNRPRISKIAKNCCPMLPYELCEWRKALRASWWGVEFRDLTMVKLAFVSERSKLMLKPSMSWHWSVPLPPLLKRMQKTLTCGCSKSVLLLTVRRRPLSGVRQTSSPSGWTMFCHPIPSTFTHRMSLFKATWSKNHALWIRNPLNRWNMF